MADFYTILRNAIGDSVGYDREARELLYRRAREALKGQLDALEPPLSEEQKATQMAQLDEAAERVEAEFAAAEAAAGIEEPQDDEPLAGEPRDDEPGQPAVSVDETGKAAAAPAQAAYEAETAEGPARHAHTGRSIAPPRRERGSGGGRWGLVIVVLLILGGAGLGAWRWPDVAPLVEQVAGSVQAVLGEREAAPADAGGEAGASGDDDAAAQRDVSPETAPRTAPEPAVDSEAAPPSVGEGEGPPEGESEEREVLAEKLLEPEPALRKDQDRVEPTLPAAERAFMIVEQGNTGSDDLRYAGSAQWRLEGSGAGAVVTVTVQIPEREALVSFAMRRNNDDSLPASHMVDISHQGGASEDGPITNVPGLMVRVENSETPVPMRSAGALIMPGHYLLGMSGSEEDRAHNLSLLKNAQWLEIPAMFESRRRLVLVIEVGESGAAALNGALAAWSGTGAGQEQE